MQGAEPRRGLFSEQVGALIWLTCHLLFCVTHPDGLLQLLLFRTLSCGIPQSADRIAAPVQLHQGGWLLAAPVPTGQPAGTCLQLDASQLCEVPS